MTPVVVKKKTDMVRLDIHVKKGRKHRFILPSNNVDIKIEPIRQYLQLINLHF